MLQKRGRIFVKWRNMNWKLIHMIATNTMQCVEGVVHAFIVCLVAPSWLFKLVISHNFLLKKTVLILIKLISSIIYNMSWKYFLFECNFFFQYMLIFMYMLSLICNKAYKLKLVIICSTICIIWILGGPYEYPMQNCRRTAKFFPTSGLIQR